MRTLLAGTILGAVLGGAVGWWSAPTLEELNPFPTTGGSVWHNADPWDRLERQRAQATRDRTLIGGFAGAFLGLAFASAMRDGGNPAGRRREMKPVGEGEPIQAEGGEPSPPGA